VRSYSRYDIAVAGGSTVVAELHSVKGSLTWMGQWDREERNKAYVRASAFPADNAAGGSLLSFGCSSHRAANWRAVALWAPHWAVVVVTGLLPAWRMLTLRRRNRGALVNPVCDRCGYNLTANVSGVCPDCGTARL
jgi:hypothetical protein